MTLVYSNTDASVASAHVLIIGVANSPTFEPLRGLGASIARLCDWWLTHGKIRLPEDVQLGSVELLLSADAPISFRTVSDKLAIGEPTAANVQKATLDWLRRVKRGGHGYLHWAGHGATRGEAGLGVGQLLYCSDSMPRVDEDAPVHPNGINWGVTAEVLRETVGDSKVSCFIDCCRTEVFEEPRFESALLLKGGPRRDQIYEQFCSAYGADTFSYAGCIRGAHFQGGPIGTAAVLDAFDRFGGQTGIPNGRVAGSPETIDRAIFARMKHLHGHIPQLAGINPSPTCLDMPVWRHEEIIDVRKPRAILSISLPKDANASDYSCRISGMPAPLVKRRVHVNRRSLHSILPLGDHRIELSSKVGTGGSKRWEMQITGCCNINVRKDALQ